MGVHFGYGRHLWYGGYVENVGLIFFGRIFLFVIYLMTIFRSGSVELLTREYVGVCTCPYFGILQELNAKSIALSLWNR